MSDNTLLRRHAERWAESKRRPFDGDLLETVVGLRHSYDDLPATSWPAGTVEALLLERWPAHGPPDLPDPDTLRDTLDTFWRFLRATGRMSSGSAAPADLLKEARRALPKMAAACADRSRFSQGRVLQDFGRSIGIRLDDTPDADELNERLGRLMQAWNELPTDERVRLMPDPSPRSPAGQAMTDAVNAFRTPLDDDAEVLLQRGDPVAAARQARESAFLRGCLALADWVGAGREVTSTGVLRPAVAREAYDELGLAAWDREWRRFEAPDLLGDEPSQEVQRLMDQVERDYWRSAADCLPLERMWWSCADAGLIEIGSRRAKRADRTLETDEQWLLLGITLLTGLFDHFERYRTEPLEVLLFELAAADDGRIDLTHLHASWRARWEARLDVTDSRTQELLAKIYSDRLEWALHMFADTGLWIRDGDRLRATDLGLQWMFILVQLAEEGYFGDDSLFDD